ncbi:MAG: zf-TFIIB domain-containing protein [FCB group bacterium]|nr:zf-TFIIB domain-containing protein [FCB group bacterium]
MNCPKCKQEMKEIDISRAKINTCSECKGLWFDKGEFRKVRNSEDSDLAWMKFSLWQDNKQFTVTKNTPHCPVCDENMPTIKYGDTGVEIDYCIKCSGIWLDKGEFGKIIDALEEELLSMTAGEYLEESLREVRELLEDEGEGAENWKHLGSLLRLLEYRILAEHHTIAQLFENFTSPFG